MDSENTFSFSPIGRVSSCFSEKFGIPRQAGLAPSAFAEIHFYGNYGVPEALRGLEEFSHIWVIFVFHASARNVWRPTVRPPRLGGNRRMGVYATRSPFRPNPLGLSAVRLEGLEVRGGSTVLKISGVDFLDGTPVLDIKPYLPYGDALFSASGGFASDFPEALFTVTFSHEVESYCQAEVNAGRKDLRPLIRELLSMDTRPAYSRRSGPFGTRLAGHELRWHFTEKGVEVTVLLPLMAKA